jgi:phage tail-like protein
LTAPAPGWLADQLPAALGDDAFVRRFLGTFEEIAGSLRDRVDGLDQMLDAGTAPPEFVRWMGGWLGLAVQPGLSEDRQRALVRAAGPLWSWRGTRKGLRGMLEAYTGSAVDVQDSGGVFRAGAAPAGPKHVRVRLERSGELSGAELTVLVRQELPPDADFDLDIAAAQQREH